MFEGLDSVKTHYDSIKDNVGAPEQILESVLNELGYLLLWQSIDEAIDAFALATELYPLSENAWNSLSDGYLEAKSYGKALAAIKKSIDIAKKHQSKNLEYFQGKHKGVLSKMKN
ncbi:hypothetical protein GTQ40_02790 [Flavobacteriaceae bacterium R38]|nr:hypothetical protein [Flavobacteriaceae bacterium R38]